jgi:hypothetical protein
LWLNSSGLPRGRYSGRKVTFYSSAYFRHAAQKKCILQGPTSPLFIVVTSILVLLKKGGFELVRCEREDVFTIARVRKAGICELFDDPISAEAYVEGLRGAQKHWPLSERSPRTRPMVSGVEAPNQLKGPPQSPRGSDALWWIASLSASGSCHTSRPCDSPVA